MLWCLCRTTLQIERTSMHSYPILLLVLLDILNAWLVLWVWLVLLPFLNLMDLKLRSQWLVGGRKWHSELLSWLNMSVSLAPTWALKLLLLQLWILWLLWVLSGSLFFCHYPQCHWRIRSFLCLNCIVVWIDTDATINGRLSIGGLLRIV